MPPDEIEFEKDIYDNVVGFVGITESELEIISTPIFQRLRNIKQLGLANLVFPGALQNRFNHSIGVLHYADEMVCSLQKKGFLKGVRKRVRMAALLHDIGHYPLSHITERVVLKEAKSIPPPNKLIVTEQEPISEKKFNHPIHKLNLKLHPTRNDERDYAHHERMGSLVIQKTEIKKILKKYYSNKDITRIHRLISGIEPSPEKDIIHSELDADKFDYLTRDSHQTGVTYGVFDVEQIIRHLELSDEGELVAGEKSKRAVEHYLMSRYFLYSQVIHHKTVASFNLMAQEIYRGLLERGIAWSYKDLLGKFDDERQPSYLIYDDEYFFDLMKGVEKDKIKLPKNEGYSIEDDKLRTFIHMVLNRQRLKLVDNQQELLEKRDTRKIKEFSAPVIESLCKEAGIEPWWFIVDEISVPPTKINPYRSGSGDPDGSENEAIKVITMEYNNDGTENKRANFLIHDKSSIIRPLSLYQLNISRVYTKDENYEHKLKTAIKNHRMNA
ncbi:MAG: HD domain-containing protein [Candidatus Methanoperedens sp.]